MTDRKLYMDDPFLGPFISSMVYVTELFFMTACTTQALRDEDVSFPPGLKISERHGRFNELVKMPIAEIFRGLE